MLLQVSQFFGLNVVYHSGYLYIMCCKCGDNDGYRCRHKSARQIKLGRLISYLTCGSRLGK
jgi:hypothetical protein